MTATRKRVGSRVADAAIVRRRTRRSAALPILPARPQTQPPATAWVQLHRTSHGADYIGIVPGQVLNSPTSTGMVFWSINPYIGCEFGCAYCYARETHRWTIERASNQRDAPATAREAARLPAAQAFEQRILVKQDAAAVLARTIDPTVLGTTPVVIGTATDPYQPAERRLGITRKLLEVFLRHEGLQIAITTKSALVTRDIDLLVQLARRHRLSINCSLASMDRELLRRLEPRSPTPQARLRAVSRLSGAGIRVDLLAMPILPGLTDGEEQLRELMTAARDAGARWVTGGPLRMGPATRHTLLPWLDRHRPELAARYRQHYDRHRNASAEYRRALQDRIRQIRSEVGFDAHYTDPWLPIQGELWDQPAASSS